MAQLYKYIFRSTLTICIFCITLSKGNLLSWLAPIRDVIDLSLLGDPDCLAKITNASYEKEYKGSVYFGKQYIFLYYDTLPLNATARVTIAAGEGANVQYPLQCVIREQNRMSSWEVPLALNEIYSYDTVSQSLCPDLVNDNASHIAIEISSMSPLPINFTIYMTKKQPRNVFLNDINTISLKPAEPWFFLFEFPNGVRSVVVKAESIDKRCMLFSIQDAKHCPVDNFVNGMISSIAYQTVSTKGAITLTRDDLEAPKFYIVLVLMPDEEKCTGPEFTPLQPPIEHTYIAPSSNREKNVTIFINESITDIELIIAVSLTLVVYFAICLFTIISISIALCVYVRRVRTLIVKDEEAASSEQGAVLCSTSSSVVGDYGTISRPRRSRAGRQIEEDSATESGNGDTSDVVEREYDTLEDIGEEKYVARTKVQVFVADLSRKDYKRLHQKFRMYWCNLLTVLIFYGLPVIQLMLTLQQVVNTFGVQDSCYYNFYCAHRLSIFIAFNNVVSNVGYVMLGLLFFILAKNKSYRYRKLVACRPELSRDYGIPQHYGLFYAMGIGLMMEGVLSACYHVCPNKTNYQFDTAFMFITASLCMLKIYQTRHADISPHAYKTFLILALITVLILFGVTIEHPVYWVLYAVLHIICFTYLTFQIYYMGSFSLNFGLAHRCYHLLRELPQCHKPQYPARMIMLIVANVVNIGLAVFGAVKMPVDFATYIVSIFIVNLTLYLAFYIGMKCISKERIPLVSLIFILLALLTWVAAFLFFFRSPTSWERTPAQSRGKNLDCMLLNFYDNHDVWHFLSALAMFFSFLIVLTLDDNLSEVRRDTIPVF